MLIDPCISTSKNENIKRNTFRPGTKIEFAKLSLELRVSCFGDQRAWTARDVATCRGDLIYIYIYIQNASKYQEFCLRLGKSCVALSFPHCLQKPQKVRSQGKGTGIKTKSQRSLLSQLVPELSSSGSNFLSAPFFCCLASLSLSFHIC